jgi:hypothetical protein
MTPVPVLIDSPVGSVELNDVPVVVGVKLVIEVFCVYTNGDPVYEIVGIGLTVKVELLVAVPPPVVTDTVPVVPDPTTAVSTVPVLDAIDVTAVPPILTFAAVAPVRFVPFITKLDPTHPLEDPKLVIVGVAATV